MNRLPLKKLVPHGAALLIFLLVSCIYFFPQLKGYKINQSDITSYRAMAHEAIEFKEEHGYYPLWTNSMFSGMPTYQIVTGKGGNQIGVLEKIAQLGITRPIGYFIGAMVGFYILFLVLGINPWLAIAGSVAFALSTNNLVLYEAGHTSKVRALFTAAPMFAGAILAFRGKYLGGGLLFAASLAVNLYVNHYQMTYYLLILIAVYGLMMLIDTIRKGAYPHLLKAAGVLILGALIAIATSSSKILTTMEYASDTMRGEPILEENTASAASSSETEGLAWEYAMRWSNNTIDLLAMIVPRAAGGSGAEFTGENSHMQQDFRQRGVRVSTDVPEPLYWGALPFTSGPAYFGAVMIFLFLLGAFVVKGRLKWWLVVATGLTILMSMGRHFEVFNKLLFDYFPMYNKFRAPSSILSITALLIPILGILGIAEFLKREKDKKRLMKGLYAAACIAGGVCVLLLLIGPSVFDFQGANDAAYGQRGYNMDAVHADRIKYMRADSLRSLAFILLAAATLWMYAKGRLSRLLAIAFIGLLAVIDLWGIGTRYLDESDFIRSEDYNRMFVPQEADKQILRDETLHYRVHDITGIRSDPTAPFNSSLRSYYHKTIGGYHAAKLQRYQDIIDYYILEGHQHVLNMLNTRYYIVSQEDGTPVAQRNPDAFGNAWFVEDIRVVGSADEEIEALVNLDPRATAVIHEDFRQYVQDYDPIKNGSIRLTEYAPDRLVYESQSQSDQLAVFSEVWYGPDKGWKVFIDGEPAVLLRANYILRAVKVPQGQHTIEMVFDPSAYNTGKVVSLIASLILLGLLLAALYIGGNRLKAKWAVEASRPEGKSAGKKPGSTRKKKKRRKT